MDGTWFYLLITFSLIFFLPKLLSMKQTWQKKLPPSPPSIPILGHLHLMKEPLHRTLHQITSNYGPIVSLFFGSRRVVVISSPNLLEDCFNKNDVVLANRPQFISNKYLDYNCTSLIACDYGDHWRNLRRVLMSKVLSANRLNDFVSIRKEEVGILLKKLFRNSKTGFAKVGMKSWLSEVSFNIAMRVLTGKRYFGEEVEDEEGARQFVDVLRESAEVSKAAYPGDFIPFLQWINFQGMMKRLLRLQKKSDEFFQKLVDEHRNNKERNFKTVIDSFLSLQESEPERYSDEIIKGLIMVTIFAGTETVTVTMEWAMTLLLNHPEVLKKARAEIDEIIGHGRLVEESDCPKLPYLQNIINETHRLYPALPIISPHKSADECIIGGYHVQPRTMLLVNAWAIHRDPTVWNEPTEFRPERFEGSEGEAYYYKLIPFGLGRRACPGAALSNRIIGLALASLIQCFEWDRPTQELLDMSEAAGITMPKLQPLEAMCRAREPMIILLQHL